MKIERGCIKMKVLNCTLLFSYYQLENYKPVNLFTYLPVNSKNV